MSGDVALHGHVRGITPAPPPRAVPSLSAEFTVKLEIPNPECTTGGMTKQSKTRN